jgi:hypothetical protein
MTAARCTLALLFVPAAAAAQPPQTVTVTGTVKEVKPFERVLVFTRAHDLGGSGRALVTDAVTLARDCPITVRGQAERLDALRPGMAVSLEVDAATRSRAVRVTVPGPDAAMPAPAAPPRLGADRRAELELKATLGERQRAQPFQKKAKEAAALVTDNRAEAAKALAAARESARGTAGLADPARAQLDRITAAQARAATRCLAATDGMPAWYVAAAHVAVRDSRATLDKLTVTLNRLLAASTAADEAAARAADADRETEEARVAAADALTAALRAERSADAEQSSAVVLKQMDLSAAAVARAGAAAQLAAARAAEVKLAAAELETAVRTWETIVLRPAPLQLAHDLIWGEAKTLVAAAYPEAKLAEVVDLGLTPLDDSFAWKVSFHYTDRTGGQHRFEAAFFFDTVGAFRELRVIGDDNNARAPFTAKTDAELKVVQELLAERLLAIAADRGQAERWWASALSAPRGKGPLTALALAEIFLKGRQAK